MIWRSWRRLVIVPPKAFPLATPFSLAASRPPPVWGWWALSQNYRALTPRLRSTFGLWTKRALVMVSDSFLVVVLDGVAAGGGWWGVPATPEVCVLSIPSPRTFAFVVILAGVVATGGLWRMWHVWPFWDHPIIYFYLPQPFFTGVPSTYRKFKIWHAHPKWWIMMNGGFLKCV